MNPMFVASDVQVTMVKQSLGLLLDLDANETSFITKDVLKYANADTTNSIVEKIQHKQDYTNPAAIGTTIQNVRAITFWEGKEMEIPANSNVQPIFSDGVGMILCAHDECLAWIESKFLIQRERSLEDQNENIEFILEDLIKLNGNGCSIWKGKMLVNGMFKNVAAKVYCLDAHDINREFENWHRLRHENIVELFGAVKTRVKPYQGIFFMELGSPVVLKQRSEFEVLYIMEHVFKAVDYMHTNDMIHMDIKLENIIVVNNTVKMIDFTGAYFGSSSNKNYKVEYTHKYLAPESKNTKNMTFSFKNDIWTLGLMFWMLLTNSNQVDSSKTYNSEYYVKSIPNTVSNECRALVMSCLQLESQHRPTSHQLVDAIQKITGRCICIQPPLQDMRTTMGSITTATITTSCMFDTVVRLVKDSSFSFCALSTDNTDHLTASLTPFATRKFFNRCKNVYISKPLTEMSISLWDTRSTIIKVCNFQCIFNDKFTPREIARIHGGDKQFIVQGGVNLFTRYFTTTSSCPTRAQIIPLIKEAFPKLLDLVVYVKQRNIPWISDADMKLFTTASGMLVKGDICSLPSAFIVGLRNHVFTKLNNKYLPYQNWVSVPYEAPKTLFCVEYDQDNVIVFKHRKLSEKDILTIMSDYDVKFKLFEWSKWGTCAEIKDVSAETLTDIIETINQNSKIVFKFTELDDDLSVKAEPKQKKRKAQSDNGFAKRQKR